MYEFSQIYIDTKKQRNIRFGHKILLKSKQFKINENNKPRVFANTSKISEDQSVFKKSIFTLYVIIERMISVHHGLYNQVKCSTIILKKTIYYDNAVVKVYNIPIFYFRNYLTLTLLWIEDLDFYCHHSRTH